MGYVIRQDVSPAAELERVICEQVDRIRSRRLRADEDPAAFIHDARVSCKKIRAALRLARPMIGKKAYRQENERWRDLARGLSAARDVSARLEGFDGVVGDLGEAVSRRTVARVRARFTSEEGRAAEDAGKAIDDFCLALNAPGPVFPQVRRSGEGVYLDGLERSYASARRAMRFAYSQEGREAFHEWRKQVKHHALQVRLLRRIFPETLAPRVARVRDLAECLGRIQDTDLVISGLSGWRTAPRGLLVLLEERRSEMIDQARILGKDLFGAGATRWIRRLSSPADVKREA